MEEKVRVESGFLLLWQMFWVSLMFPSLLFYFEKPPLKFRGEKEEAFHSPENFCRIPVWIHTPYYPPPAQHSFPRVLCLPGSGLCRGDGFFFPSSWSWVISYKRDSLNSTEKEQPSVLRGKEAGFYPRKRFCILFCTLMQAFCFRLQQVL